MERIPLHSWEMGLSIQYHVTIINQLNDLNLMGYYIKRIVSLSRCCEGNSLISSLSRDMLLSNQTTGKLNFDTCYITIIT